MSTKNYLNFFGTKISVTNKNELLMHIDQLKNKEQASYVTFSNVHVIVTGYHDHDLKEAVNSADIASPDGMPLVVAGRHKKFDIERCTGPDTMEDLFRIGNEKGYSHYFYGSTEETLEKLSINLLDKYPGNQVVGRCAPPFRPLSVEEDMLIMDEINDLSPDFVWIGLGAPKQEIWMYKHKDRLNRGVMLGVGAAFDFHAELKKRAPEWMQNRGLEWLYRLIKEPKRLFARYTKTNWLFLWYLVKFGVTIESKGEE